MCVWCVETVGPGFATESDRAEGLLHADDAAKERIPTRLAGPRRNRGTSDVSFKSSNSSASVLFKYH